MHAQKRTRKRLNPELVNAWKWIFGIIYVLGGIFGCMVLVRMFFVKYGSPEFWTTSPDWAAEFAIGFMGFCFINLCTMTVLSYLKNRQSE
jgi:hypothetical protein